MPSRLKGYIIHLDSAKEREPVIAQLQHDLSWNLTVVSASDGSVWDADPTIAKKHPWTKERISKGNIGCTETHLRLLREAAHEERALAIFEDDCQIVAPKAAIDTFLHTDTHKAGEAWDILLLGANEYVEASKLVCGLNRVRRFWGTHALLLRPRAVEAVLRTFKETQAEGFFMPADWLYNEAIKRYGLICYGPPTPRTLCRQAPGYVSAINGGVRK